MTVTQLSLLPVCAAPGCQQFTDEPGTPCADCVAAFGPMLRPGRPMSESEIANRDEGTRLAYRTARLRGVL